MTIHSKTEIADNKFRSLDEIDRYLKTIQDTVNDLSTLLRAYESQAAKAAEVAAAEFKINVNKDGTPRKKAGNQVVVDRFKKVVVPNVTALRKNFAVVDELYEKLDVLKTLEATVALHFKAKTGSGSTLAGIKKLAQQVRSKLTAALKFLEKVASKHAPEPFMVFVQNVVDKLAPDMTFEGSESALYVREIEGNTFEFTNYVRFRGVVDDEDKMFPELYFVFTCQLVPQGRTDVVAHYYVTLLSEFTVPGKFNPGTSVDSVSGAVLTLGSLLELENFSNSLGTLPIPIGSVNKSTFSMAKVIQSIEVDERSLSFVLVPSIKKPEVAQKIVQQLYLEVKALLTRVRAKLKVRVLKELGKFKIQFTLSNLAGPDQVSVNDLQFLRERLGVDDDRLRKIVRIINGN